MTPPTTYDELNLLLAEIGDAARTVFGDGLVGGYVVGSFAVGDADLQSDCDFLVVVHERPNAEQERAVRALHAEIPARPGHWTHHLEGSYAVLEDLRSMEGLGRPWLFIDHGWTEMSWSDHCNREVVRWSLREHGITVTGADPRSFVAEVPPALMRARMRADLPSVWDDIVAWAPLELAWTQRYVVSTCCRVLYTLATAEVASKRAALEWGTRSLDPQWRPLLVQVRDDRHLGFDPDDRPRPGSLDQARVFAAYAARLGVTGSGQ